MAQVVAVRSDILRVRFDVPEAEALLVSSNHKFWIKGKGWIRIRDAKPGDKIIGYKNMSAPLTSIEKVAGSSETTVYNFEVEGVHSYSAGKHKVVVHNGGPLKDDD